MARADEVLGNAPPQSFDAVLAGLTRLRRIYDLDSEEAQSRGREAFIDSARVQLLDAVRDWIRPTVEREARERAEDRIDVAVHEAAYD